MPAGSLSAVAGHNDTLDKSDLLRRLRETLDFADRTITAADPQHSLWQVDLGQVSGFDKLMLEGSVLALLAGRSRCVDDLVAGLIASVAERCDRARLAREIRRQPGLVASFGTALVILDRFGLATDGERRVIRSALDSPFVESVERTPFRLLDRHWVLGLAGHDATGEEAAIQLTTAARRTHPIYLAREDIYAITHAVMYTTDFGVNAPPKAFQTEELWQSVDACLAWCLVVRDHDLTVELLLTQLLLRKQLSAYGAVAWGMVRRTWDQLGFVPGPSLSADEFKALEGEDARQYAHYHMYHTMFVAGLLVSALLEDGVETAPAARREAGTSAGARDRRLAALLEEWADTGEPAVVRRMALDGLLTRAAKASDVARLGTLLAEARRHRAATVTVEVARAFRIAQLDEADESAQAAEAGEPAATGAPIGIRRGKQPCRA